MKKIAVLLTIVAILMMTMPAAAGSVTATTPHTKVGEYFYIPPGSGYLGSYPANQPFPFAHGWQAAMNGPKIALARLNVRLILDGNEVEKDFIEYYIAENAEGTEVLVKRYVFNFPDGLAGLHHIQFYYTNTCAVWQTATPPLDPPLICDDPQGLYELLVKDWWVVFQDDTAEVDLSGTWQMYFDLPPTVANEIYLGLGKDYLGNYIGFGTMAARGLSFSNIHVDQTGYIAWFNFSDTVYEIVCEFWISADGNYMRGSGRVLLQSLYLPSTECEAFKIP